MKFPPFVRSVVRRVEGLGKAPPISPKELAARAAREPVVIVALTATGAGSPDPRLPGEQRTTSYRDLASAVADLPKDRLIATHCT